MNQDLSLSIVGWLAAFALRVTFAFGVCLILSRLVTAASHRFALWATFLYGSAAYWLYLAIKLIPGTPLPIGAAVALPQPAHMTATLWNVPESWGFSLEIALQVCALIYAVTVGYNLISHANKLRHLRWVMGFATEPPAEVSTLFRSLAQRLGMRPPRLLMLSGASSPATFGWLRPVIVLPTLCVEHNPSELEDILLHELHHVYRRDSFWNALGIAARTVLCFHPAAWYAMKAMRFDRELACDFAVVSRAPGRRGMYAESLLRFAKLNLAQDPVSWGIDFAASTEHLTVRVHSILTEVRKTSPWMRGVRTGSGLALLALFVGVAPSLGILLGYTHPLTPQPEAAIASPTPKVPNAAPTARRRRAGSSAASKSVSNSVPVNSQAKAISPPTDTAVESEAMEQRVLLFSQGPQLQHRPSASVAGVSGTKSQIIPVIDESDSGHTGKQGDKSQTVQQTATVAAAIWKRVGDLDRH